MSERKDGWYHVKSDAGFWGCAQWNGYSWHAVWVDDAPDSHWLEIGPRIPAPDEAPPIGQRYRNEAGEVVAVVVQADQLRKLKDSISGDCYMGEDWERAQIEAMLAALPEPD